MSRNGSGTYVLPAGQPVVTGTTISSTTHNTLASDLANALTTSVATDGQSVVTANIPMAGYKLTGLGAATVAGDAVRFEQALGTAGLTLAGPLNEVQGADIASSATVNLTTATGDYVNITGTTTITAITLAQGYQRTVKFAGILTLTNGASLILPGAANITTAVGDTATFIGEASSVVRCVFYQRASGLAASAGANNDITSLGALTVFNGVQKRQTVLAGAQTRVAIGTGLAVNLLATTTPVRVSFAAGIGAQGTIDRVSTLSADVTGFWSGLTANVVNYLFYDRNTSTGAVTGVASILPYIAQNSSVAISVASGQHTYVYDTGQMYVGNGATATAVDRTAEGECLAGAATITTVTSYAMMREYDSGYTATIPAAGTAIAKNHNLGTNVKLNAQFLIEATTADANWPIGYIVPHTGLSGYTGVYAYPCTIGFNRLIANLTIPTNGFQIENVATGAFTTITAASWKYKIVANTPW